MNTVNACTIREIANRIAFNEIMPIVKEADNPEEFLTALADAANPPEFFTNMVEDVEYEDGYTEYDLWCEVIDAIEDSMFSRQPVYVFPNEEAAKRYVDKVGGVWNDNGGEPDGTIYAIPASGADAAAAEACGAKLQTGEVLTQPEFYEFARAQSEWRKHWIGWSAERKLIRL